MLVLDFKYGIRVLLLSLSELTLRKRWSFKIFLILREVFPKWLT